MYLIVGLGNPGKEYEHTRHNMGFLAIDAYAKKNGVVFQKEKFGGIYAEITKNGEKVILLKPQKYINLSGEIIKKFVEYFKIDLNDLLILVDDLDIKFGNIKIKYSGSSAGHNGLKNIQLHLKTQEYKRVKLGISNNKDYDTKDYVLSKIEGKDNRELESVISTTIKVIDDFFELSFDKLMTKYNKKQKN